MYKKCAQTIYMYYVQYGLYYVHELGGGILSLTVSLIANNVCIIIKG